MSIFFKKLRYKNFLSTGNAFTEIELCQSSTTLIIGKNGGGKSTIIDALHYCLYGKPFRNVNKPQLVNSINQKNMLVELELMVGSHTYLIRRGMKPNVFEVYQDSILINQNSDFKEYQEILENNIIKMSSRTFSQIVVLGSAEYVPFMRLPAGQRRSIIEDLLDIEIFSVMNVLLKDKVSTNKSDIQECSYKMKSVASQIEMLESHLKTLQIDRDKFVDQKKAIIKEFNSKIETLNERVIGIRSNVSNLNGKLVEVATEPHDEIALQRMLTKIQTRVERLTKEIDFYEHNDNCPTCRQGIPHDYKNEVKSKNENTVRECSSGIDQLNEKIRAVRQQNQEIKKIGDEIASLTQQENVIAAEIRMTQENIQAATNELVSLQTNDESLHIVKDDVKGKKKELQQLIGTLTELNEQKQIYDIASVLLKDTGIKTKIIKQYVPVINKLINKYLAAMDFFVNFELNENFEEVIKSRHRDEFTYSSFSEGEKARLDIAILFTWRAIAKLRNSASTNLLIMDEVFDGSLDAIGNEELLKIITDLANDTNVFIISHRSDHMSDRFERTIKFEKNKNFSEIVTA